MKPRRLPAVALALGRKMPISTCKAHRSSMTRPTSLWALGMAFESNLASASAMPHTKSAAATALVPMCTLNHLGAFSAPHRIARATSAASGMSTAHVTSMSTPCVKCTSFLEAPTLADEPPPTASKTTLPLFFFGVCVGGGRFCRGQCVGREGNKGRDRSASVCVCASVSLGKERALRTLAV